MRTPDGNVIRTEEESQKVLFDMYDNSNKVPNSNIYLFACDSEHISDSLIKPYKEWDQIYKVYKEQGVPTHPTFNGPFARYIQLAT